MPMSSLPPAYDSRPNVGTTLTPYLQLSHRLSLAWLAYPILSILFVVFRLILSGDAAQDAVNNAKGDMLTACQAAQEAAVSGASYPRYMALGMNELVVKSTNAGLDATRQALVLALTMMEAIINFVIDLYRSTFLCFLELIVRGALSILISATQEVSDLLQSTASGLRTTIQDSVSNFNSAVQDIVNTVNKLNPFGNISAPTFNVPDLSALANVTIPTTFTDALTSLNNSLPSPAQLKNELEDIIDTPFELVKKEINDTFLAFNFNSSVLPVPDRASITFCDQMDTGVIDDLGEALVKMVRIGIIILVVLAVVLLAGNCLWEWYKWRSLKAHLQRTREAWASDPAVVHMGPTSAPTVDLSDHNLLMLAASSEHPLITRLANQLSAFFRLSPAKNVNLRWFMHYIFHPPALACFVIGFFGLLSVQLQLWALAPLEARFQQQVVASTNDFSTRVSSAMNSTMYNQSAEYANGVNAQLGTIQETINSGLFGWVNGTTTTLNDTIATFYSDVQNITNAIFGNTPLAQPAQEFIACLIGSKVDAVENVLTFLNENLRVNVTLVNSTVLVLSPEHVDEAAQPIARAAVGGGDGSSGSGLVGRLIDTYAASLRKERIMFAIFLGLWGIVVLMGLAIIFWHSYGRDLARRRRARERDAALQSTVTPFHEPIQEKPPQDALGPPKIELRSFTPIPLSGHRDRDVSGGGLAARFAGGMGKSWDSFFDREAPDARPASPPPSRIGALSRMFSTSGRASPADSEKNLVAPVGPESTASWWTRVRFPRMSRAGGALLKRPRSKPRLTISPTLAESARNSRVLPVIETTSPSDDGAHASMHAQTQAHPPSAWSLSPTSAPPKSWLTRLSGSMPPAQEEPDILFIEPMQRRKPSVPDDVSASMDDRDVSPGPLRAPAQSHLEVPVALHHGFPLPPPLRYAPSVQRAYMQPTHTSAPVQRVPVPVTPEVGDPFATPFDDNHAVHSVAPNSPGGRYPVLSPPGGRNPFADAPGAHAV